MKAILLSCIFMSFLLLAAILATGGTSDGASFGGKLQVWQEGRDDG